MKQNVDRNDMWAKFGRGVYQVRFFLLTLMIVIAGFFTYNAQFLPSALGGDGFKTPGDYIASQEILEEKFGRYDDGVIVVIERTNDASLATFQADVKKVIDLVAKEKNGKQFIHPGIDPSMQKETIAYLTFTYDESDEKKLVELNNGLQKKVSTLQLEGAKASTTGRTIVQDVMNTQSQE
ncbi:MAG: hypothetical protein ACRC5C_15340, partial [Bacilli bacterium]